MGLISLLSTLFGGAKSITDVAGAFAPNAEKSAEREAMFKTAVAAQFAAEFQRANLSWWDSLIDGLNRLPRPVMAFGTIGLFVYAMADPVGFGEKMQGLALMPDPLWWLLGAIVTFYFGAREMHKSRTKVPSPTLVRGVVDNIAALRSIETPAAPAPAPAEGNAALAEWNAKQE